MSTERSPLTDLFAACWKNDALKARFMADPRTVLAECGFEVPDGMKVIVVENTENTIHIILPMTPDEHDELSMDELSLASGGGGIPGESEDAKSIHPIIIPPAVGE